MYKYHPLLLKKWNFLLLFCIVFIFSCTGKNDIVQNDVHSIFPCDVHKTNIPNDVYLDDPRLRLNHSGLKCLELEIDNNNYDAKVLQYRAVWFDLEGLSIPTVMSRWNRFVVPMHSKHRIFVIAPSHKAWRVEVTILKAQ